MKINVNFKKHTAILLITTMFIMVMMPLLSGANATGIGFIEPQRTNTNDVVSYVPKQVEIKKEKIDLVARKSIGALYVSASKTDGINKYQGTDYVMRYVGEKNGFYMCLTFDTMQVVYIPKSEGKVFKGDTLGYPARQDGTYSYLTEGAEIATYSADGATVSVSHTTLVDNYEIDQNIRSLVYYVRKTGKKPVTVTVKDSMDVADDGEFTFKTSATLLMDGTETVTIEDGEIISFYFAPTKTIKRIVEKYEDRFEAKALVMIPAADEYIAITDDLALIYFD